MLYNFIKPGKIFEYFKEFIDQSFQFSKQLAKRFRNGLAYQLIPDFVMRFCPLLVPKSPFPVLLPAHALYLVSPNLRGSISLTPSREQLGGCSGAVQVSDACLGCSLSLCHFRLSGGRGNRQGARERLGQAFILLRRT